MMRTCWNRVAVFAVLLWGLGDEAPAGSIPCEWAGVDRIVAVGDIHGDHGQLVKCLVAAGVFDGTNRWIGGTTHLVQTGDVLDRGPDSLKAMDLLMDLERQADAAGGHVHALLGNHEEMVLGGWYQYVMPEEYAALGGKEEYARAMSVRGRYGRWIQTHNAVIKINDILFVHGGISSNYTGLSLSEINEKVRKGLDGARWTSETYDPTGPLWYRGMVSMSPPDLSVRMDAVLRAFAVKHVVVGHTVSPQGIRVRAGGGVIAIDTGMSRTYAKGPAECLLMEQGRFFRVTEQGPTPLSLEDTAPAVTTPDEP